MFCVHAADGWKCDRPACSQWEEIRTGRKTLHPLQIGSLFSTGGFGHRFVFRYEVTNRKSQENDRPWPACWRQTCIYYRTEVETVTVWKAWIRSSSCCYNYYTLLVMIKNLRPVKQQAATVGLHLLTYSQWNCHFGKEEAWLLQLPVDGLPQANHWQVRAAWGIMNMKLCKAIFSASRVVSTTTTTNFIREKQETKQLRNSWMKTTSDRLPDNWPSVLVAIDKQIAYIATPLWVAIAILSLSVCHTRAARRNGSRYERVIFNAQ